MALLRQDRPHQAAVFQVVRVLGQNARLIVSAVVQAPPDASQAVLVITSLTHLEERVACASELGASVPQTGTAAADCHVKDLLECHLNQVMTPLADK